MTDSKTLRADWEKAEAASLELQAKADRQRDSHRDRLQKARDKAAEAQKAFLDAQVVESLMDRPDGDVIAENLGLELPKE